MQVTNAIQPNEAQLVEFSDPQHTGPVYMVNLLKFRDWADYPDGRSSRLTGKEAYAIYTEGVSELLRQLGGALIFSADVQRLAIGEVEDLWDKVAIAMYPSRAAMLEMMQSSEMQHLRVHRVAGLAGQLNLETQDPIGTVMHAPTD